MIVDELRTRLRASPFLPFTVVTASGSRILVHHHDYAWLLPRGGEFYVQDPQGQVHLIYPSQITELVHDEPAEEPSNPNVVPRP